MLLLALALRITLWGNLPRTGMISDEAEYLAAADWLANGRGFRWHQGWLWTRAPLYPLFLAAHIWLFGRDLTPIYLTQMLLSLINVGLVYVLAWQVIDRRLPALIASLLAALYLPFASYPQMLLSETLYLTLLLGAFVALGAWVNADRRPPATDRSQGTISRRLPVAYCLLGGVLLGLATLTRGLTLAFLPIVALWILDVPALFTKDQSKIQNLKSRISATVLFVITITFIILPWSLYASRTYGGTVIIDTTGAYNLLLGARTAYDGERKDAPARNFVLALLDQRFTDEQRRALVADACLYNQNDARLLAALDRPVTEITQGERQQLMTAEGLCLLQAAPGAFMRKSVAELVDLFQINYTGAERLTDGFALGWLPRWYTLALFLLDDTLYILVLPLAVIGWGMVRTADRRRGAGNRTQMNADERRSKPSDQRVSAFIRDPFVEVAPKGDSARLQNPHSKIQNLIALWWLYNLLTAPLLFAINRFRLPLLPFAFIFAAYALMTIIDRRRTTDDRSYAEDPQRLGKQSRWHTHFFGVPRRLPGAHGWSTVGLRWPVTLALILTLIATTPYAYLEPHAAGQGSAWASYLGPYPSSLDSSIKAWTARPGHMYEQQVMAALRRGDAAEARVLLEAGEVPAYAQAIAWPLLAGLEGRPQEGMALIDQQSIQPLARWQTEVVRGELLRQMGDYDAARVVLSPTYIDDQNPVEWSWEWLHPPPLPDNRLDLGGDLDLGYIQGFYLGEGEQDVGTFRWSGPEARLRFPQAGSGAPQQLCLRADGRGWYDDLPLPHFSLALGEQTFATLELQRDVQVYCAPLPASPRGADIVVTLRSATFVPDAADLLGQQGPQVGQLRLLGVRLDWAELRETS